MSDKSVKVQGQSIEQTYQLESDVVGEPMLGSLQCDFSLCEADFLRLTSSGSKWLEGSIAVFLLSLGYAISIVAKHVDAKLSNTMANVEAWEYWSLGIGLFISLVLLGCGQRFPSERQRLLKEMNKHFERHPRQRRVMRRVDDNG